MLSWLKSLFSGGSTGDPTSICEYVREGDIGKVRSLLEANPALVNFAENQYGMTPLHVAASDGRAEIAELLLGKGAAVEARDRDAATPLFGAALAWIIHANLLRTRIALHLIPLCQNADLDGCRHACARQPDTMG